MKITGTFKDYDGLLAAYGTDESQEIDQRFKDFLKYIAGKDCILANYNPVKKTFDAALLVDKQDSQGNTIQVQEMLDPIMRRYSQNMGIDKLASHNCQDCDKTIYCTVCGSQWPKDAKNDWIPEFTWGEIYDGNCTKNATCTHFKNNPE